MKLLCAFGRWVGKPPGYERVVRAFYPPEKCAGVRESLVTLRGEPLFLANPHTTLGWYVFFFGTYEGELRAALRSLLRPGFIAVDVGANVGWHTLLMAQLVGDSGRVLAFEPNQSVRERLQYNISINRFSQIEVLGYALSDRAGVVQFHGPPVDDPTCGDGFVLPSDDTASPFRVQVEAVEFDSLVEQLSLKRLDLIKMDIEGFEWSALQGCEKSISHFRPHVVFEYNSAYVPRSGGSHAMLQEFFRRHRYRLFAITRMGLEAAGERWPDSVNIWAAPEP